MISDPKAVQICSSLKYQLWIQAFFVLECLLRFNILTNFICSWNMVPEKAQLDNGSFWPAIFTTGGKTRYTLSNSYVKTWKWSVQNQVSCVQQDNNLSRLKLESCWIMFLTLMLKSNSEIATLKNHPERNGLWKDAWSWECIDLKHWCGQKVSNSERIHHKIGYMPSSNEGNLWLSDI